MAEEDQTTSHLRRIKMIDYDDVECRASTMYQVLSEMADRGHSSVSISQRHISTMIVAYCLMVRSISRTKSTFRNMNLNFDICDIEETYREFQYELSCELDNGESLYAIEKELISEIQYKFNN